MAAIEITFCNRAYTDNWFDNVRKQNPEQMMVINAIIAEIESKDGGDIVKVDIYQRNPEVEEYVKTVKFDIIPTRGQMLQHNGNGIRHAKYSRSKSIALVWEKIGETIFVTFDDHARVGYHRAIAHLRNIKLGKPAFPRKARTGGKFYRKLKDYWKYGYTKKMKGISLRKLYFE